MKLWEAKRDGEGYVAIVMVCDFLRDVLEWDSVEFV